MAPSAGVVGLADFVTPRSALVIVVGLLEVSFAELVSVAPLIETVAVFVTVVGGGATGRTVSVMSGRLAPAASVVEAAVHVTFCPEVPQLQGDAPETDCTGRLAGTGSVTVIVPEIEAVPTLRTVMV